MYFQDVSKHPALKNKIPKTSQQNSSESLQLNDTYKWNPGDLQLREEMSGMLYFEFRIILVILLVF